MSAKQEQGRKLQAGDTVPLNKAPHNAVLGGIDGNRTFQRADNELNIPLGFLWEVAHDSEDGTWKPEKADDRGHYIKSALISPETHEVIIVDFVQEHNNLQKES